MATAIWLTAFCSFGALPDEARQAVDKWVQETFPVALVPPQRQIELFVKPRIPALEYPATPDAWIERTGQLRRDILDKVIFRGVPQTWREAKSNVEWFDAIETGKGYRIRKLRYEVLPGFWTSALLYEPAKTEGKLAAVLNVNGHEYQDGKAKPHEQIRSINLAKRGFVVLHPEWLNCGELRNEVYDHNRLAYLDLCGVSGVSVFYLAMKRGLDVLAEYPSVDPARIAMTGVSGGGWQTIILSALDPRIALPAPNAGYIGIGYRAEFLDDVGDLEQNPTDLLTIADYTHLTAMLAPRPALLLFNEKDDCCFPAWRSRLSVYEPVIPFYSLFGKQQDFQFYENKDPGNHNYDRDNREQFYRFISRRFLPESQWIDAEIPSDDEVLTLEALRVGLPENNANFVSLAAEAMKPLPLSHAPQGAEFAAWQTQARGRLSNLLRYKPIHADGLVVKETSGAGLHVAWYKLTIGETWVLPAIAFAKDGAKPHSTIVAFADKGAARLNGLIAQELENDSRVLVVDPLFMGANASPGDDAYRFALMLGVVGERTLGVQAAQVGAVVEWARDAFASEHVALHAAGPNAGIVALAACGLNPTRVAGVTLADSIESLKHLIERRAGYNQYYPLFCFGLLHDFDVPELVSLCSPVEVRRGDGHTWASAS